MPKFGTKSALFGFFLTKMRYLNIFRQEFQKNCCHTWNQHPKTCQFGKFNEKRMPKFGTKNVWFAYFGAAIWKQYCHIRNYHLPIYLITKFREKTKMPKFGKKNVVFGYCHIWNQRLRISLIAKFCEETKMPKFRTKNALSEFL